jgi:thioredoxin-dependent peroxiredoxin
MRTTIVALSIALLAGAAQAGDVLQPGATFPAWELTDHTGAKVTSQSLAGKPYLLWFYPKASTPGCTTEGQGLRDQAAAFEQHGVEIVGVSFDAPADNASFVQAQAFPFRLLSDPDRKLGVAVGAAADAQQPAAKRISYLVGADGKVVKAYPQVVPANHAQEVLGDLAAVQVNRSAP